MPEKTGVKQCPLTLDPRTLANYDCMEEKCAWWQGNQCTILNIADCLNGILRGDTVSQEIFISKVDKTF